MKIPFYRSLRFRLIASVVIIEVVMLSIMVWNVVDAIYQTHTERLNDTANSIIQQISDTSGNYLVSVDYAALEEYAEKVTKHPEVSYLIIKSSDARPIITLGDYQSRVEPQIDLHPTRVTDGIYDIAAEIKLAGRVQGKVLMGFSLDIMKDSIAMARNRSIAIAVTEITLSVIVTIFLGIYLTRNIRALSEAAVEVGDGNYDVTLPVKSDDEIGLSARAFNKMVVDIAERTQKIKTAQERIQLLMDSTAEAIVGIDENTLCMFVNPAAVSMLGYDSAEQIIGKDFHLLVHHTRADGTPYPNDECSIRVGMQKMDMIHVDDELFWRADGSSFPVEAWTHPIIQDGEKQGYMLTFIDISARKQVEIELEQHRYHLEDLVLERTAALQSANDELKAFSYSVSHDLRAPLRHIDGYSLALLEDYANNFDDLGKNYLYRLRKGAQRMGELIDDMLRLANVSRREVNRETVNITKLATETVNKLRDSEPERNVTVGIMSELVSEADKGLVQIVIENLLGNAWKYTSKKDIASIEVGCQETDKETIFYVRDTGAGFDIKHVENVFQTFKRLHKEEEFEGSGIGMAIVARVIKRHGGQIWAEAEVGKGATFYFTLIGNSESSGLWGQAS